MANLNDQFRKLRHYLACRRSNICSFDLQVADRRIFIFSKPLKSSAQRSELPTPLRVVDMLFNNPKLDYRFDHLIGSLFSQHLIRESFRGEPFHLPDFAIMKNRIELDKE